MSNVGSRTNQIQGKVEPGPVVRRSLREIFESSESSPCAICLDIIPREKRARSHSCCHVFCQGCLASHNAAQFKAALESNASFQFKCPLCRVDEMESTSLDAFENNLHRDKEAVHLQKVQQAMSNGALNPEYIEIMETSVRAHKHPPGSEERKEGLHFVKEGLEFLLSYPVREHIQQTT
jgi:hypothetical protein